MTYGNWTILGVLADDLLKTKVISKIEAKFLYELKIPIHGGLELWQRKDGIENKVLLAVNKEIVQEYKSAPSKYSIVNVISDDLGTKGVRNPVDGKVYDSKSAYHKSVRAAGCQVVGNEPIPAKKREIRGDFDCRREVAQAIERTGLMEKMGRKYS